MPYAKGYIDERGQFDGKDFIRPPIIKGPLLIGELHPKIIEKYKIVIGQITPFTCLKITV